MKGRIGRSGPPGKKRGGMAFHKHYITRFYWGSFDSLAIRKLTGVGGVSPPV